MLHDRSGNSAAGGDREAEEQEEDEIRDIHAVTAPTPTPTPTPTPANRGRRREGWETSSSFQSTNLSVSSEGLSENFSTMSREFNALVLAGSAIQNHNGEGNNGGMNLARIGEDLEETNPLAIVPDNSPLDPVPSSRRAAGSSSSSSANNIMEDMTIQRVKKEEVESKISAWQTAKIAKINNRFKREDAVISGWESEAIQKAATWMKKVDRKLEEKRAKALEKTQNVVAKARRKVEEKRASAEARRGTKVARVLEVANLMRAVGRAPTKRSFF